MLSGALVFLIDTLSDLFTAALLLRFYMQWARAPWRNPLSEFLIALTDFVVRPARRVVPGLFGLDLATVAAAWSVQFVALALLVALTARPFASPTGSTFAALALLAFVALAKILVYIVMVAVVVQAVLTWVNPYSPVMPTLNSLSRPLLRVFQRVIPPIGNVDLSPLFVVLVCQLLLMVPVAMAEGALRRLL
ncbi:MAG: YggT family protein [Burkholderiales bacterium]|nr:YggT family protein [Burkholderiales bacterium]